MNGVAVTRTSGVARTSLLLAAVAILILGCGTMVGRARRHAPDERNIPLPVPGEPLEPDGRICRTRFGWTTGVRRIWRLHAVRPDAIRGISPGLTAILLAGLLAAVLSVPVASLIFRLKGAYFAIGTWVIAEVFRLGFAQVSALGGGSGSSLPVGIVRSLAGTRSGREALSYWLALGATVIVLASIYLFLRSRRGLALKAIRDNETAAAGFGVDIWRTKLEVYVVTAALTSIIGGLIFLQKLRISPDAAFSVNDWTAFVIFIVVIGGIGTLEGPIIGTLVFFVLRETLADFGTFYLMIMGLVAIAVMLKAPKGIWGLVRDRFDLELFPLSFRVKFSEPEKRS